MAEALVSAIIQQLANVIADNAKQEWRLVTGVDRQVQKLQRNFEAIQCLLEDAEERQFEEKSVERWLSRLKEVAYDMEDVVDEWKTAVLKLEIDGVESIYVKKKVCSFLSCFACCRQVVRRHDIAAKIKEINEELDVIAQEKDRYELARRERRQPRRLESTSFVDVSTIHGRDEVKNKIVSTLLGGNDIQTISIVGMGGIGKTALAQLIFHDDKVRAHFQNVIWVCVSDFFDPNKIALAILGGLDQNAVTNLQNPISLQLILTKISEKIRSAKFLLVLDDVWTDRDEDWVPLKATFQTGTSGSKILVTTRKKSVARVMESSDFDLEQLSDEVCWSIIKQLAFRGKNDALCKNLEEGVGREIAEKCDGLPLVAKTLGKIRPCLLYCAIFPKDFVFRPAKLIKHWIAHGYLSYNNDSGMEEEMVGLEYFNYLASRSFFQDFKKDSNGDILECKMHDIVHDFVQYLTNEEIVEVEVNSSEDVELNLSSKKAHHLRVTIASSGQFPVSINGIEKLRSLLIIGAADEQSITWRAWQAFFQRAKCLRVLEFNLCLGIYISLGREIIPEEIEKLIHLRCLDLSSFIGLKKLPDGMCELYNLQYLNISGCDELEKLPEGIGKLVNLRSLDTSGCGSLYYPKGIGKLTSLRELTRVIARVDGNNTKEFSVGDLENLDLLRGSVDVDLRGDVINVEELKRAKLHNKIHLQQINFRSRLLESDFDAAIQASNPLPNLKMRVLPETTYLTSSE
ncbi:hypothetical protein PTKIN_Ptkin08bG0024200 [Pterospermum kingtungense]